MTLIEAIAKTDEVKPNALSNSDKIRYISNLDLSIKKFMSQYEVSSTPFNGYTDNTDMDTELLVEAPFDDIYIYWLAAQIDYWNDEVESYDNNMTMYSSVLSDYRKDYHRHHMPKQRNFKFF